MVKKILQVLLIFIMLFFVSITFVFAQDNKSNLADILVKIEQRNLSIKDMQFNYLQKLTYTSIDEKQSFQGQIKYKDKNHIYMYQKLPEEQYIYVNGNKITTYAVANKQAIVENWKNILNNDEILMSLIELNNNWKSFSKKHDIQLNNETENSYVLFVKPINPKLNWTMFVELNKNTYLIDTATYSNSNYIMNINLMDYTLNNNFNKNDFEFKPEQDIDVIDF